MIDRRKYIKDTYLRGINKYKHYFFEDKKNKCYISIKKILELDEPFFTRKGLCLINQNYYIVEIVPLHENYCIRVFVNDKKEIILYYFDITLQNGFDSLNDSLYYDDLYLDVVKQDENIDVLDEDELIEDYLRLSKVKPKKWWKTRIDNEKEIKHRLIEKYQLNQEDVFRYGIVEKLKEDYILVIYKNYQVHVEKYHI